MVYRFSMKPLFLHTPPPQRCLIAMLAFLLTLPLWASGESLTARDGGDLVRVGDAVPAFSATLRSGQVLSESFWREGNIVLVFFNTTCSDCRKELPLVQEMMQAHGTRYTFVAIGRQQDPEAAARFWQENGLSLPYAIDADRSIFSRFARVGIPRIYVIRNGTVTAAFQQKVSRKKLRRALR